MRKLFALLPVATAALVGLATPAHAHTPAVTAKCSTLTVDLRWYDDDSTVTVTIDGTPTVVAFADDYHATFGGTKTWSVVVDNGGEGYDSTHSGVFVDCTPPTSSTTVPPSSTTTKPPITLAPPVRYAQSTAVFGHDCATKTAWVQLENHGDADDRVTVAGHEVTVPARLPNGGAGLARINLDRIADTRFTFGPVASLVNNTPITVTRAPQADATSAVNVDCVYLDTAVEARQVTEPPAVLAFTGAADTAAKVGVAVGLMLIGGGLLLAGQRRRLA